MQAELDYPTYRALFMKFTKEGYTPKQINRMLADDYDESIDPFLVPGQESSNCTDCGDEPCEW